MKADEWPDQKHCQDIEYFICKSPTERTHQKLGDIGNNGNRYGAHDARPVKCRSLEHSLNEVGHLWKYINLAMATIRTTRIAHLDGRGNPAEDA